VVLGGKPTAQRVRTPTGGRDRGNAAPGMRPKLHQKGAELAPGKRKRTLQSRPDSLDSGPYAVGETREIIPYPPKLKKESID